MIVSSVEAGGAGVLDGPFAGAGELGLLALEEEEGVPDCFRVGVQPASNPVASNSVRACPESGRPSSSVYSSRTVSWRVPARAGEQ